jgi:hypothetical protein
VDLLPLPRELRADPSEDVVELTERLMVLGVGDGHPVVPPTPERVAAMLGGRDGSQALGTIAPLQREATVEDVAVCAVMAGCMPQALPVLTAAIRAIQQPQFNLLGVTTTTGSVAIGAVLHGDIVGVVGANAAGNCLGPGNRANATIGRALAMAVRVIGCALPGLIDMAICGQPGKYGLCFAELPGQHGWPGLHEERGVPSGPGGVTVLGPAGTMEVVDVTSQDVTDLLDTLAASLLLPVGTASDGSTLGSGEPVAIVPPEWVMRLSEAGWTKARVREHLWDRAQVPLGRLAPGLAARADVKAVAEGRLRISQSPDDITIVVAGGPGTKATLLPLWPGGSASVTVPVDD